MLNLFGECECFSYSAAVIFNWLPIRAIDFYIRRQCEGGRYGAVQRTKPFFHANVTANLLIYLQSHLLIYI